MKDVAIVGLPGSGKSTVFTAVSGRIAQRGATAAQAVVEVPDERLERIAEIYASAKITRAQVRLLDIAGLDQRALGEARAADALAIVVRGFGPDADPARDLDMFRTELAFVDLATVEKVGERKKVDPAEGDIAKRAQEALHEGRWLAEVDWSDDERRIVAMWTPLTMKPSVKVINAEEPHESELGIVICGALEAEATELPPDEAVVLLKEFGIDESAAGRFVAAAYNALGLLTFYTGGPTEAHAWETKRGSKAPQAAGAIHSDFERAFIRAERVSYDDLVTCGSEQTARDKGLLRVEGKDYVVQDGDLLNILHGA
jgi:ribosome-binding ATPase YchF (GTP1/OBG family)